MGKLFSTSSASDVLSGFFAMFLLLQFSTSSGVPICIFIMRFLVTVIMDRKLLIQKNYLA